MKAPTFVVALLFLVCTTSFAQAAQNEKCTFEHAVSFNTAVNLAEADYVVTVNNATQQGDPFQLMTAVVQAFNAYKAKIQNAADGLPTSCWLELVTAENRLAQCQAPVLNALAAVVDRMPPIAQRYAQTGNRQAYETDMRGIITDMLNQVPRQCWFQVVTVPSQTDQSYCSQAWSQYNQCYQTNQNAVVHGGTLQICYRPICNIEETPGADCSAYHQCVEEYKRCIVRTRGTGPCLPCKRPPACP